MRHIEYVLPAEAETVRGRLTGQATFQRRSTIADAYFENGTGTVARIRRQDTIAKLSCTPTDDASTSFETIVLDARACQGLLEHLGFRLRDRLTLLRDTWRKHQYHLHLDRIDGLGTFLTMEIPLTGEPRQKAVKAALKCLRQLGFRPPRQPKPLSIDKPPVPAYTAHTV
jgi:adenylate cyclase class IV